MTDVFVTVNNLSKRYSQAGKSRLVLDEVSFTVLKGEFVAIIGQSGAGKTTLLRLLSGLEAASSGQIVVGNHSVHTYAEEQRTSFRQQNIGFAFQLFELMDRITVVENVALPLILSGTKRSEALTASKNMLKRLDVGQLADAYPDDVSGGEMQRIALARALTHKPPLLLADEPTASLDSLAAENALDLLAAIRKDYELTIIMVTHNTRAAAYADRVLRLKQGRLLVEKKGMLDA